MSRFFLPKRLYDEDSRIYTKDKTAPAVAPPRCALLDSNDPELREAAENCRLLIEMRCHAVGANTRPIRDICPNL